MSTDRIFPCVLCAGKFSKADIEALRYLLPSQVCRACYEGPKAPACFGKYNVTEDACTRFCPDREACKSWPELVTITPAQPAAVFAAASQKITASKLAKAEEKGRTRSALAPFRDGTIIGAFFARARRAEGLTLEDMKAVCAEIESPVKDYYRKLYSGFSGGWKWTARLDATATGGGVLFISEVKQVVKGKGKRCN